MIDGADLGAGDTAGVVLAAPTARRLEVTMGDTVRLAGRLDPQAAVATREQALVVRGIARFLYDPREQASIATLLPVAQRLAGLDGDRASMILVRAHDDAAVPALVERIRARGGGVDAAGIAELVRSFRDRMLYFRQLSYILGTISLIVTVLLIATILTIGVNERLGEIATLRAIGIGRATIMRQVVAEGAALTFAGAGLGILLGLATARYLDSILGDFPDLPAGFSFFVPRADALGIAAGVLLLTGTVAGLYPAWLAARAPIAATLREESM
jgi:putative ABC transport system permease protein